MRHLPHLVFAGLILLAGLFHARAAATVDAADLEGRLRLCRQIAREQNDKAAVAEVESAYKEVKEVLAKDPAAADAMVRKLEPRFGIDPGGWKMSGQPIFRPNAPTARALDKLAPRLQAALASNSLEEVRTVAAETLKVLADQAGLPDVRRKGDKAPAAKPTEREVAETFLLALEHEAPSLRRIRRGEPIPDQMPRFYAGLITGACAIRPAVDRHFPGRLGELDSAINGAAGILMKLQQPSGHFPFPDLRGKNIRFGAMTEKFDAARPGEIKDGWIIGTDPSGGTQFDTGECGMALLTAARTLGRPEWKAAGIRAADWAIAQPLVPNWNYNAFSVSLLAEAFRGTGDRRYLSNTLHKARAGVLPGQARNGRWMDPHNARTPYHLILLRSLNDLRIAMAKEPGATRTEIDTAAALAVDALIVEFEALGVTNTSFALVELRRHAALSQDKTARLQAVMDQARSVVWAKCRRGNNGRFGASGIELAACTENGLLTP